MKSFLALMLLPVAVQAAVTAELTPDAIIFRNGDQLITEYHYAGTVKLDKGEGTKPLAKPYFHPLNAPGGIPVTRGWPLLRGLAGETTDHFHQKSAWFCHGDVIPDGIELKSRASDKHVQGVDFWSEFPGHGRIVCTSVDKPVMKDGVATVRTQNEWRTPDGVPVLTEDRSITVSATERGALIAVESLLTAAVKSVTFGDTKEGSFGVRVHDHFRLTGPKSMGVVTDDHGAIAGAPAKDNLPMWGRTAAWHDYSGRVDGKPVGVTIFTDPRNAHASAWHTRAYGLLAANPFGRAKSGFPAMKGKTDLVKLAKGETLKLRFGVYAHNGDATAGKVAEAYAEFSK